MTLDDWLSVHPFLVPLAHVRARIDAAVVAAAPPSPAPPDWEAYRADFLAGVPLLHSATAAVAIESAGDAIVSALGALAADETIGALMDDARDIAAALRDDEASSRVVQWLLDEDEWTPPHPGVLHCVGWLTLTASLASLVETFAAWRATRDDEQWMRRYCPTCGALPAMAHLVGTDPGRQRFLCCGCCGTKWRYGRTRCPFCEAESHKLASVTADGENGLRIEYCDACRAYLKAYAGHGSEAVLLADWTSLHLDIAAHERGWERRAASLYAPPSFSSDSGHPESEPAHPGASPVEST